MDVHQLLWRYQTDALFHAVTTILASGSVSVSDIVKAGEFLERLAANGLQITPLPENQASGNLISAGEAPPRSEK